LGLLPAASFFFFLFFKANSAYKIAIEEIPKKCGHSLSVH